MYLRLRGENPFISGKAARKSCASRSITLAPQPCCACRARMSLPDLPVQQHQFAVDRQRGALLGGVDTAFRSASQSA